MHLGKLSILSGGLVGQGGALGTWGLPVPATAHNSVAMVMPIWEYDACLSRRGACIRYHCGKELGHTYVITTSYASYIRVRI